MWQQEDFGNKVPDSITVESPPALHQTRLVSGRQNADNLKGTCLTFS